MKEMCKWAIMIFIPHKATWVSVRALGREEINGVSKALKTHNQKYVSYVHLARPAYRTFV